MIITNNSNLPLPIYNAIIANPYTRGDSDISVTDLIDSPRISALKLEHDEDITTDASDLVASLLGQAMHTVLERGGAKSVEGESETRLYSTIEGWRVSGQFDYLDKDGVIWDWKFVSVQEYIRGVKVSRETQLNLYAALARRNNIQITGLRIGFVFRDYSQWGASKDPYYPKAQAIEVPITLWDADVAEEYLVERVRLHQAARSASAPADLQPCTPEERWATPEQWAVYKNANKKASKLFTSENDAEHFAAALRATYLKDKYKVVHRPGGNTRCERFCYVLRWCEQGKELVYGSNT